MEKIKILAVDDEAGVLKFIKKMCSENEEYELTVEQSPLQAIEKIEKEQFHIFIVDCQMPEMTGIDFLLRVSKLEKQKHFVSVFCTAYGTTYLFQNYYKEGLITYFLEKPYEVDDFKEMLLKAANQVKCLAKK